MKNRKENRTFELQETCNFPEVFRHCSIAPDSLSTSEMPDAQIGYIRAYHDGYQWQGQYFPCRNCLRTKAFDREPQDIYRLPGHAAGYHGGAQGILQEVPIGKGEGT